MSTYREVKCYVYNHTGQALNYASDDISHGEFDHGGTAPVNSINSGTKEQTVFYIHKTTGSSHGCTGNVTYTLPDGSSLVFMFNNPKSWDGSGETGNCWFYAAIDNITDSATNYYVTVDVSICDKDGNNCAGMALDPPTNNELINATVSIYSANG